MNQVFFIILMNNYSIFRAWYAYFCIYIVLYSFSQISILKKKAEITSPLWLVLRRNIDSNKFRFCHCKAFFFDQPASPETAVRTAYPKSPSKETTLGFQQKTALNPHRCHVWLPLHRFVPHKADSLLKSHRVLPPATSKPVLH